MYRYSHSSVVVDLNAGAPPTPACPTFAVGLRKTIEVLGTLHNSDTYYDCSPLGTWDPGIYYVPLAVEYFLESSEKFGSRYLQSRKLKFLLSSVIRYQSTTSVIIFFVSVATETY